MNRLYLKNDTQNSFFGYELGYSDTLNSLLGTSYQKALYNGNITGTVWRSKGDGQLRKYDYSYDAAGRLLSAAFTQFTDGAFNLSAGIDYSVMMGNGQSPSSAYDANGNILYMVQYGLKLGSSALIDRLSYAYTSSANKLARVTDAVNDPNTRLGDFKDGANTGADDYLYDVNGNLTQDLNKGIANIVYNQLNLPEFIDLVEKGTVRYTYTAAGTRLKKQVFNRQTQITITTLYLSGFVYETKQDSANNVLYNNKLLFCGQEEGRIRALYDSLSQPGYITGFACDYFIKDHLGNIRAVITSQKKEDQYPPASMETAQATTEEALYANLPQTRTLKTTVPGYPADTYTSPNDYVAKVSGDGNKIGPSITLKVMAGDKFNIRVTSWYRLNGAAPGNPVNPLTSLLAAMQGGVGGAAAASHGATIGAQLQNGNILTPAATQFLNSQTYNSQKPKAFINWILLDEQFQYTAGGFEQAGNNEELKEHIFNQVSITKTGYLYVYVSNATPNIEVFFDNLQLTHSRGTLLETNEYYPFGLLMKNISYRSQREAGFAENKYKYNGKEEQANEFSEGSGLDMIDYGARMYDAQTGRWQVIDPLAEMSRRWTPYNYGYNNPIQFIDPDGRRPVTPKEGGWNPTATLDLQNKLNNSRYDWSGADAWERQVAMDNGNSNSWFRPGAGNNGTSYFDAKGNLLYQTTSQNYWRVFVVSDIYKQQFINNVAQFKKGNPSTIMQLYFDISNILWNENNFGANGDAYDLNSINHFYKENYQKFNIQKIDNLPIELMDKITLDGNEVSKKFITSLKGAEASFSMKKDKGVWTVDMQTISSNNSFNTSDAGSSGVPNGHLHPYAASLIGHDLSYSFGGKWTHLGRVNNGALVSQPDFNRARDQNKTFGTQYNIMININSIILYNASGNNPIYINR